MGVSDYIAVASSLVSFGVTYGVFNNRVKELERRVEVLEDKYDSLPIISERTARIEAKMDMIISKN